MNGHATNRRQFFRGTGLTVGTLAGLGLDLKPVAAAVPKLKIKGAREVPSVCPYCAVGCGQLVSVRDGQIVNIEGNPDSPINRGTLCPKGAATFQLAVNPNRADARSSIAHPCATEWDEKDLDWAMDRIAERVKATRDATFTETWKGVGRRRQAGREAGQPLRRPSPRSAGRRWTTSGTTSSSS